MPGSALPGRRLAADTRLALGVGLAAFVVYRLTMLPTVTGWDTGEAQFVPLVLGTMHPTGFPAYTVLGFVASIVLAPFGSPAMRMNLFSALLVATAAAATVAILLRLRAPRPIAAAAGLGFALTPVTWSLGAAADVHALHGALAALIVLALVRWNGLVEAARAADADAAADAGVADRAGGAQGAWRRADRALVLAAALFGVALANHALTILLVPAVGLYVLAVQPRVLLRPRLVVAALGACAGIAALFYLELPIRGGLLRAPFVYGTPGTVDGFLDIVLGRQFQSSFFELFADPGAALGTIVDQWSRQLGVLVAIVLPALLVTAVRHPRFAILSATAALVTSVFASVYQNAAIERYYLVPLLFGWAWIALMASAVVERLTEGAEPAEAETGTVVGRAWRGWRPTPESAVALVLGAAMLVPAGLDLDRLWHAEDRSQETGVATWLDTLMTTVEPDAVIVSWWSYSTPIWYGQLAEGRRPDIRVVDDRTRIDENLGTVNDVIDANLDARPVYVIRAQASDLQDVAARFAIEPVDRLGEVYRVTGRLESQP